MSHVYIFITIFFTVYGQIVIKWQVGSAGTLPVELLEKFSFIFHLLFNPWILSGLFSAFIASLSWMAAMSKFPLSYAYPFMSLAFVLVLLLSAFFFKETITLSKIVGMGAIVAGIIISTKG